jgi:hypothetical protein
MNHSVQVSQALKSLDFAENTDLGDFDRVQFEVILNDSVTGHLLFHFTCRMAFIETTCVESRTRLVLQFDDGMLLPTGWPKSKRSQIVILRRVAYIEGSWTLQGEEIPAGQSTKTELVNEIVIVKKL